MTASLVTVARAALDERRAPSKPGEASCRQRAGRSASDDDNIVIRTGDVVHSPKPSRLSALRRSPRTRPQAIAFSFRCTEATN